MKKLVLGFAIAVAFGGGIGLGTLASTADAAGKCHRNIICPNIVAPVICSDGQVYVNSCYADRACATGCVPYGA